MFLFEFGVCISNVDINTQLPSGLTTPILPSELACGCCIMHLLDEGGVRFGVGLLDILYLGKYVHPTTYKCLENRTALSYSYHNFFSGMPKDLYDHYNFPMYKSLATRSWRACNAVIVCCAWQLTVVIKTFPIKLLSDSIE